MLTDIQQQAIVRCLTGLDLRAQNTHPWPAPTLLAVLIESPILEHLHPAARRLGVVAAPFPTETWDHPDGPVAALREVAAAAQDPVIQARLAAVTGDVRLLAWAFQHNDVIIHDELGPRHVRYIDAVDLDDRTYILTRLPGTPTGAVTVYAPGATDDSGAIEVLRTLARTLRTG